MESPFEQLSRLRKVVDYILDGSDMLTVPQRVRGDHHLDVLFRMSQSDAPPMRGVKEARIVYVPGCTRRKRLEVPYVVRRFIWNQAKDFAKCRSGRKRVIYPDIHDEYFRIDDRGEIVEAGKALDAALNSLEVSTDAGAWFELVEGDEGETVEGREGENDEVAQAPVYHRWLAMHTWPLYMELQFSTSQMKRKYNESWDDFNSAWERLWNALGAMFDDALRLRRVTIRSFDPSPKKYARALASIPEDA